MEISAKNKLSLTQILHEGESDIFGYLPKGGFLKSRLSSAWVEKAVAINTKLNTNFFIEFPPGTIFKMWMGGGYTKNFVY